MRAYPQNLALMLAILVAGCGPPESGERPAVSIEPEVLIDGSTRIVRNRDLPLWGGIGRLSEEMSIGDGVGDDAYLLGDVQSLAAADDRIFVADSQTASVRAYDLDGIHLFDVGGQGSGPGEFRRPWAIGVSDDDRLVVRDQLQRRVHVFSTDGELIDDWPSERGIRTTIGADGSVYVMREDTFPNAEGNVTVSFKGYAPDGGEGEWIEFPDIPPTPTLESTAGQLELMAVFLGVGADWMSTRWVPFAPRVVAEIAADGAMVSGRADAYRFEVRRSDGSTLAVEKEWTPTAVEPAEADWYRRRLTALWRAAANESWTWVGADIPAQKGAFYSIVPAADGRFWVIREMPGVALDPCNETPEEFYDFDEAPCWRQPYLADVFDAEGRFLGPVNMPDGIRYDVRPFIRDDMVIALLEDAEGVAFVKRFRLASPERQ